MGILYDADCFELKGQKGYYEVGAGSGTGRAVAALLRRRGGLWFNVINVHATHAKQEKYQAAVLKRILEIKDEQIKFIKSLKIDLDQVVTIVAGDVNETWHMLHDCLRRSGRKGYIPWAVVPGKNDPKNPWRPSTWGDDPNSGFDYDIIAACGTNINLAASFESGVVIWDNHGSDHRPIKMDLQFRSDHPPCHIVSWNRHKEHKSEGRTLEFLNSMMRSRNDKGKRNIHKKELVFLQEFTDA